MQSLKRLLIVIIALALAASVVFFTLENRGLTQLVFFGWQTPELPLALYILSAFVMGLVIGPLLSWWPHQRLRIRYNKQIKQLSACEKRIKTLQESNTADESKALPHTEPVKTP
ncbi:LapA family protein [Pseudomonas sp. C27(2019)]|uniref:LapA family protein n=1 Tax=Pseudomonas sp. C27(2019) TaxID=2604941 RepID=UPI0012483F1C|nr:LapA family protein [Pseudomonas sp. C27(2019)]QEY58721.1 LapA family protein [Pseudomonas sp. C27(2019)]